MSTTATVIARGMFTGLAIGESANIDTSDPRAPMLVVRDHHGVVLSSVSMDSEALHALAVDAHEAANVSAQYEQDEADALTDAMLALHHGFRFAADDCE